MFLLALLHSGGAKCALMSIYFTNAAELFAIARRKDVCLSIQAQNTVSKALSQLLSLAKTTTARQWVGFAVPSIYKV